MKEISKSRDKKTEDGVCEGLKSYIMDFGTSITVLTDNGKELTSESFRKFVQGI